MTSEELVQSHVAQLAEHFESVQIFVTRCPPDGTGETESIQWGAGNYFARTGQVRKWIIREEMDWGNEGRE